MKAIIMQQVGDPEVLTVAEIPPPSLQQPTDVLVRVHAAGVNPIDTKLRSQGTYYPDKMPTILGCDAAGTVEAIGTGVQGLQPGDAVYYCYGGIGGHQGNYAEYNVVDQQHLANMPSTLDFAHAAAAPLVVITAWEALFDRASIQTGDRVLIHAGAGGVGHIAIQLAKSAGCQVITTVGNQEKADLVRTLGADKVINYHEESFVEAAREWTRGVGVDVVFDTVGGDTFSESIGALRPYGHLVTLLQPSSNTDWKLARLYNLSISQQLMLSPMYFGWQQALEHQTEILARAAHLFEAGKLTIHLHNTLPLDSANEAHRILESGFSGGKLVLINEH